MIEADCYSEEYRGFIIKFYYDENYDSPRNWTPVSHMICWSNGLGDKHGYEDSRDLFKSLFNQLVVPNDYEKDLYDFILQRKGETWAEYIEYTSDDLDTYETKYSGYIQIHSGYDGWNDEDIECNNLSEGLKDFCYNYDVADVLSQDDLLEFIERYAVIMPMSAYEHSGTTVWYGSPSDPWDSGYVGYGYMTKDEVFHICSDATEDNWRKKAKGLMKAEMQEYDTYVRGEVYGYMIEVEDEDEESFSDTPDIVGESCWGFYGEEGVKDAIEEAKSIIDRYYDSLEDKHIEDIIKGCLDTENA